MRTIAALWCAVFGHDPVRFPFPIVAAGPAPLVVMAIEASGDPAAGWRSVVCNRCHGVWYVKDAPSGGSL